MPGADNFKILLQVLEQTKEIQGNTQAALHDQRQQMYRIEDGLDKVSAHKQRRHCIRQCPTAT
jgi:hypothetical protein